MKPIGIVLVTLGVVVVVSLAGYGVYKTISDPGMAPVSKAQPAAAKVTVEPVKEEPLRKEDYESYKVGTWSGRGSKNTPIFHVPATWAIHWSNSSGSYGAGMLGIHVYRANGTFVGMVANVMGKDQDSSAMYCGAGDYYLKITAANGMYGIVVSAVRKKIVKQPKTSDQEKEKP